MTIKNENLKPVIDKLRNFTGFHGCRELGNHFQYLKQEGPEKAAE